MINPVYHPHPLRYRSYLIRLWLEDTPSSSSPRIIVVNPQTGDRRGFVDWDGLVSFLSQELSGQHNPDTTELQQPPKLTKGEKK